MSDAMKRLQDLGQDFDAQDTIQSLTAKLERVKDAIRVAFEDLENFDDAGALEALRQALKDIEND